MLLSRAVFCQLNLHVATVCDTACRCALVESFVGGGRRTTDPVCKGMDSNAPVTVSRGQSATRFAVRSLSGPVPDILTSVARSEPMFVGL